MAETMEREASEMGWPAGHWPQEFERDGESFKVKDWARDEDQTLMLVEYTGSNGTKLTVFND